MQRNGVMCEYAVLPWTKIIPAGNISPRDCALIEPMSVGFHAVSRAQVIDNDVVVVIDVRERVRQLTDGLGADVVIEAVGSPATYVMAVDVVSFTGRVVCIGYAKSEVAFQTKYFVQKELDIRGSRNALPADFRAVIHYLQSGNCPIEEFISAVVAPEEAQQAMEQWAANPGKVFRILVKF